jgi:hypothetical protein
MESYATNLEIKNLKYVLLFSTYKKRLLFIYYFLRLCSPARAMASSFTRFRDHTQRRATVGRNHLDE